MTEPGDDAEADRVQAVEELAATAAEAYQEFSAAAADPDMPERARLAAARLAELFPAMSATAINASHAYARINDQYDAMTAVLFGEDMTALAAILRNRLTAAQVADLAARLSGQD